MSEEIIIVEEKKKNKLIYIIIILLLVLIILLLLLFLVVIKKKKEKNDNNLDVQKIVKKLEKKHIKKDELKILIKKASILYKEGKKEEALNLLEKVSIFSESLSYYNLGVIKLEEKKYKKALNYFKKAIKNNDSKALSAINATFCALMLKDKKLFNYYRRLAYLYLPTLSKNKYYPYYYSVVMFYLGYEYEALAGLKKSEYKDKFKLLGAIYEYLNDPFKASIYEQEPFYKGLEFAQIGKYHLAKNYLKESNLSKSKFALGLVDLKLSDFKEASQIFKQFQDNNIYPIYMFLKPSLFDIKIAQEDFKNSFLKDKKDFYDLFFYFAPYKVLNMKKTLAFLEKGIGAISTNAIEESQNSLSKSAFLSKLNLEVSKAIKLAIQGHIYLANKEFQKLYKKRKDSYIINYNLALTYAQLGNYEKAYFHFLRAYHLNPYDLKSGIFALFSADKINIQNPHLVASIKEDLNDTTLLEDAMLSIYLNDTVKIAAFLEKGKDSIFWLLSKLTIKAIFNKDYKNEALKIKKIFKNDLISHLLYFYAKNKDLDVKTIAKKYQTFFFTLSPYLYKFYYGGKLPRDWYFEFARISGLMERVRINLIKKAKKENKDIIPVLKKLAFASFYTKHFEESYTIYNDLIDNKKINDPRTLFYAAVSAIGANHHNNAIALMELAKLKNPLYAEPRYGLGLLWQEANNLNAASIQYKKIPNGFKSRFFDFNIKQINE